MRVQQSHSKNQKYLYYVICIYRHTPQSEREWFQKQTNTFQNRADYIRQEWTRQEQAKQAIRETTQLATHEVTQLATHEATQLTTPEVTQKVTSPAPPAPLQQCTQPSTQSIAQQAQPSENTTENITENTVKNTAEKSSTSKVNIKTTSLLSTIPRQRTTSVCRESASCLSKAPFLICQHAPLFALSNNTTLLASLPGYIRCAEEMEATGQG